DLPLRVAAIVPPRRHLDQVLPRLPPAEHAAFVPERIGRVSLSADLHVAVFVDHTLLGAPPSVVARGIGSPGCVVAAIRTGDPRPRPARRRSQPRRPRPRSRPPGAASGASRARPCPRP